MTITVNNLIRAGAMAQNKFDMKRDFEILLFPSDCPDQIRVYKWPEPIEDPRHNRPSSPYTRPPMYDEVDLLHFAARENNEMIRMGYSRKLNILCLSLV